MADYFVVAALTNNTAAVTANPIANWAGVAGATLVIHCKLNIKARIKDAQANV
jgi:hypothetical protein